MPACRLLATVSTLVSLRDPETARISSLTSSLPRTTPERPCPSGSSPRRVRYTFIRRELKLISPFALSALTQLIAGSDTTSNSSCAIMFFIIRNPRVHKKLVAALDEAFAARGIEGVIEIEDVRAFPPGFRIR